MRGRTLRAKRASRLIIPEAYPVKNRPKAWVVGDRIPQIAHQREQQRTDMSVNGFLQSLEGAVDIPDS